MKPMTVDEWFDATRLHPRPRPRSVRHLAITTIAELLLPVGEASTLNEEDKSLERVRVAIYAAQDCWPLEYAKAMYANWIGAPVDRHAMKTAYHLPRRDWFGEAKAALDAAGLDSGPT